MYDGVKAMIEAEKALGGGPPAAALAAPAAPAAPEEQIDTEAKPALEAGPHLTDIKQLTVMPVFPAGTKSLVSKYCTPEIFEANKGKCDKAGVPFE